MKATAVPGVRMLAGYRREWLTKDIVAGLVLTALLVPQGMAYAELAGLPAITGLYTSILCLVAYAMFGPSKILVLGPDSSLGPMIAATLAPLLVADGDPVKAVAMASVLALMVGGVMVVAGAAKLGFIADLLSKPTVMGYMNGLAVTILVGQLPKLFGFSVDADGFIGELTGFLRGVADGETVAAALAIGALGLVLLVVLQRVRAQGSRRPGGGRHLHRAGGDLRPGVTRRVVGRSPCRRGSRRSRSRGFRSATWGRSRSARSASRWCR